MTIAGLLLSVANILKAASGGIGLTLTSQRAMTDTEEVVDELQSAKDWLNLISEKFREGGMFDEATKTDRASALIIYLTGVIAEFAMENPVMAELIMFAGWRRDRDKFIDELKKQFDN